MVKKGCSFVHFPFSRTDVYFLAVLTIKGQLNIRSGNVPVSSRQSSRTFLFFVTVNIISIHSHSNNKSWTIERQSQQNDQSSQCKPELQYKWVNYGLYRKHLSV